MNPINQRLFCVKLKVAFFFHTDSKRRQYDRYGKEGMSNRGK